MEIKDHQNPSHEPLMNERGNSSLFQSVSYQFKNMSVLFAGWEVSIVKNCGQGGKPEKHGFSALLDVHNKCHN